MDFAYRPELWQSFFETVGLAAATLTGLLSVALSINVRHIIDTPAHLARAREAFIALTVVLTLSIFAMIPEQGRMALGVELIALCIVVFMVALPLQADTRRRLPQHIRSAWRKRQQAFNAVTLAIAVGGVGLITGRFGGFLWLLPTIVTCLVWSTYNAWNLTITAAEKHQDTSSSAAVPD